MTAPVGLAGEASNTARVRGVSAASICTAVGCQLLSGPTGRSTGTPPASCTKCRLHGYPGSVSSTSSPGPMSAHSAICSAPEAPTVTTTRRGSTATSWRVP